MTFGTATPGPGVAGLTCNGWEWEYLELLSRGDAVNPKLEINIGVTVSEFGSVSTRTTIYLPQETHDSSHETLSPQSTMADILVSSPAPQVLPKRELPVQRVQSPAAA